MQRSPRYKLLLVMLILAIAVAKVIPNYGSGNWTWSHRPALEPIQTLKIIQQQGLAIPGWQTLEQQVGEVGGHKWSMQTLTPDAANKTPQPFMLLMLRPQTWHRDLPQVDWMDIHGARGWTEDSQRRLTFTVTAINDRSFQPPIRVNARFFRGWDRERTYAVLQWYAWPTGGNASPSHWFWVDQASQWHNRQRTPWVAVSLLIPMQPLGNLESTQSQAISLGQLVQATLTQALLSHSL
ncbi:cyanoexosortase B system-associated protein [Thermocoleostomius sinensis]|uniref:Cyanoexosortase B system-associated protein n=1 Tax=Thermocoleostomius sinensis A174 TaxID=2016057 RepID=A0A9E8ZCB5_9CYAN|nr:cyanoexosortase B system-associated protein [Thermocoleostomius sinensis]WAL59232.1 cyanoexosortase B system-associated protein [Thermocoleostomius sinensis A174]